jgi:hypothetical protein
VGRVIGSDRMQAEGRRDIMRPARLSRSGLRPGWGTTR